MPGAVGGVEGDIGFPPRSFGTRDRGNEEDELPGAAARCRCRLISGSSGRERGEFRNGAWTMRDWDW